MSGTVARVDWQMGQTLLPEHFTAQEDSLLADTKQRFRALGLPLFGIGQLKWNDALLGDGTLSIQALTLILPSGELLESPGNLALNTLNLNAAGATSVSVYLHVTGERAPEAGGAGGRWQGEDEQLRRVVRSAQLSTDQTSASALATMRLGDFEKDSEDLWSLCETYIPPLLHVGASPFLLKRLHELAQLIEQFHYRLEQDVAASFLSGGGLVEAKLCLRAVYSVRRFLRNLAEQVHFHPLHVWEALSSFYIDLCLYQNVSPENLDAVYRHDQLAETFAEVLGPLTKQMQISRGRSPYTTFERQEGRFVIGELPAEVRSAKEVYFLVQKPRISTEVSLEGVKLASASRLAVVHQLALMGIPLRRIANPPFQHQFGAEVEFYLLREGEEWDHALREGALAFFERPGFEGVHAHLYWRAG